MSGKPTYEELEQRVRDLENLIAAQKAQLHQVKKEFPHLHDMSSSTHVGTWEWNVQTGEIRINERWAKIIGYTRAELEPTNIDTLRRHLHPEDLLRCRKAVQHHFNGSLDNYQCELRMRHKQGHWAYVLDQGQVTSWAPDGQPLWMCGTHLDITAHKKTERLLRTEIVERRRIERTLRESEEKYRIIFNNEIYAICIFNLETLKFLDVNDAYVKLYGYSRDELLSGMTIHDITAEQEVSDAATRQAVQEGTIFIPKRLHKKKDGSVFPVEIVGGPYTWKGKKVMFALAHDIEPRIRAGQKLQQILREQHTILETADIGIIMVVDNLQQWVNRKAAEMFQCTIGEMTSTPFRELYISDEQFARLCSNAQSDLIAGLVYETEQTLIRRDGMSIWVRLIGKATDPPNIDAGTIWLLENITSRKRTEQALQASERRFRKLFESNAAVMLIIDPYTGKIVEANASAAHFYGWSIDQLKKMYIKEINTLPEEEVERQMKRIRESGSAVFTFRHRRKDGSIRDVEVSSSKISVWNKDYLYSIINDITDRIIAEHALQQSEERLALAMRATHEAVWDWDLLENHLFYSNNWFSMLGYDPAELHHTPELWRELMHPEDIDRANQVVNTAILEKESFEVETRLLHKDGHFVPLLTRGFVLRDRNRQAVRLTGTNTDLSQQKLMEERRRQIDRQWHQLNKQESLRRMAGGVAHHFNNMLGVVIGNLELASLEAPAGNLRKILHNALQASQNAAEMGRSMLRYLGQSVADATLIDLFEMCQRMAPCLNSRIPGTVDLKINVPTKRPIILSDLQQMEMILTNLTANANEAIKHDNGRIEISVHSITAQDIPASHRFPFGWSPENNLYACLAVADNGEGIKDADIENLFDPFFSKKFTGRGLGLALVLGVVASQGGAITVESRIGQGSIFRVLLPVPEQESQ